MLCTPFWNGYFNVGGTKEELTYISVQGGIVYTYEDWFFN